MDKNRLQQQVSEGFSIRKIAGIEGVSGTTISYWLNKYGLKSQRKIGRLADQIGGSCLVCGTPIPNRNMKYCTPLCSAKDKSKQVLEEWLSGVPRKHLNDTIVNYILNRHNHKCAECGCGEVWNGKKITLPIDHIDGNWRNNSPNNLRPLCPNCHSQTDTFGSKNAGNGRPYFREYKKKAERK